MGGPRARTRLGRRPERVGGPRGWAPLHYACHSVYAPHGLVRELLERGADPNATYTNEYGPMTALYGAAGILHDPELTRLLLEHGADPDDNESVYHSTEAESPECLRLLLEHGARTSGTNALAHALDDEREEHVRLLLEAGADPNEGALVAHAVRRGRGPAVRPAPRRARRGRRPPGGETWRGDVPLRTPYAHAVLRGRDDVAAELERLGASTEVAAGGPCRRGGRARRAGGASRPARRGSAGGADPRGAARAGRLGGRRGRRRVQRRRRRLAGRDPPPPRGLGRGGGRRPDAARPRRGRPGGERRGVLDAARLGGARLAVPPHSRAGLRRRRGGCSWPQGARSRRGSRRSPTGRSPCGSRNDALVRGELALSH